MAIDRLKTAAGRKAVLAEAPMTRQDEVRRAAMADSELRTEETDNLQWNGV